MVLRKGNQQTFLQFPEVTAKAVNKEEKNSHVLAFKQWLVHFSPYCQAMPQGIREKYGKHRVIFDSSTQTCPYDIVLNHETSTDNEAIIDFDRAKTKLGSISQRNCHDVIRQTNAAGCQSLGNARPFQSVA